MKIGYKTDIGKVRDHNEDNLFVDAKQGLFMIADGMGGHQGGEVASRMALEILSEFMKDKIPLPSDKKDVYKIFIDALSMTNERIRVKAESDMSLKGMGTTVVLVQSQNNDFYISHVGDSRGYLIRQKNIKQLTEDHSVVAQMVKAGMITTEEAKTHHLRHMISQALGTSNHLMPDIQLFNWEKGDYLLLCTDGLTDMLDKQEILVTVLKYRGKPEKGCEMLIELANKKGGRDNITVILLYKDF